MKQQKYYRFFQKQILLMVFLSLIPGIVYVVFGYLYNVLLPAILWYTAMVLTAAYGMFLYKWFDKSKMEQEELRRWYGKLIVFMYISFALWTVIFIFYAQEVESNLHYIAIFTQLGASVVASALLVSERKIFVPILLILMVPLIIYFGFLDVWYGYILSLFSIIFLGVLLYSSNNTYKLIQKNYYHAHHDALTGLNNRRYYLEYMDAMIDRLSFTGKRAYMLLIDLDHFKTINDSLGHDIGDEVLKEVAQRIKNFCRLSRVVARLGGDEFIVVTKELEEDEESAEKVEEFAEGLLSVLKEPYVIDNHHFYLSASIGISRIANTHLNPNEFLKEADIAMYEAKKTGRDGVIIFNKQLEESVSYHLEIERKLYGAIRTKKITLDYQVQLNKDLKPVGCEVLARWYDDVIGEISPEVFIPIAERTGLIIELGAYILAEAFKTVDEWEKKGVDLDQLSVNISVRQLLHTTFIEDVQELLDTYIKPESKINILFEITENVLAEDKEKIIGILYRLKDMGIFFSMDDFGTGYSSLSYLRSLPVNELKIDKLFISHMLESKTDEVMIMTMLSIAKNFGLKVIIEGVEQKEQFDLLAHQECYGFQGFYFSKPLSKKAFEEKYLTI